jgi:hypothetical protein
MKEDTVISVIEKRGERGVAVEERGRNKKEEMDHTAKVSLVEL